MLKQYLLEKVEFNVCLNYIASIALKMEEHDRTNFLSYCFPMYHQEALVLITVLLIIKKWHK